MVNKLVTWLVTFKLDMVTYRKGRV